MCPPPAVTAEPDAALRAASPACRAVVHCPSADRVLLSRDAPDGLIVWTPMTPCPRVPGRFVVDLAARPADGTYRLFIVEGIATLNAGADAVRFEAAPAPGRA